MAKLHESFNNDEFLFRRKFWKVFGAVFHIYDKAGKLLFYGKQKAFKLREDMRVYTDDSQKEELLNIKTPQILDFGATYNVVDSKTGQPVGSIRRKWFKSMFKDEWHITSKDGKELGKLKESSWLMAILSRNFNLVPQHYIVETSDGIKVADFQQHFNPFILKYTLKITKPGLIDNRLLVAAGILLSAIEKRQK